MISFIKGNIEIVKEGIVIVENNNIGYKVNVSTKFYSYLLNNRNNIKIYTFMLVKEDDISLFGFKTLDELELFEKLITVSGVGPKGALSLLSAMTAKDIIAAIIASDINTLCKGQGIGKKIAQRLALELKDKVDIFDVICESVQNEEDDDIYKEVTEALLELNFTKQEILNALNSIDEKNLPVDKLISLCLKKLAK